VAAVTAATVVLPAGCGSEKRQERGVPGGALTIYVSAPTHGPAARRGRSVIAGVRAAVRDARGRAGGRPLRVVSLSSNRPGDLDWDPGTVEANARKAAADRRAIAYVGEADSGASAVSLPRTNGAGLLQVSPADGLTSLTRMPPGKPTAGPARYYPEARRTFTRLVPTDLVAASEMLRLAGVAPGRRVALIESGAIAQRELGAMLEVRMLRAGVEPVATKALPDAADVAGLVDDLAAQRPEAILLAAGRAPAVGALLDTLRRRLPRAVVIGSPALADGRYPSAGSARAVTGVVPVARQARPARRLAARLGPTGAAEGLYAYDAAALVVSAIRSAGPHRAAVVRAALRPAARAGVTGRFEVQRAGSVTRRRLAVVWLRDGRARVVPARP